MSVIPRPHECGGVDVIKITVSMMVEYFPRCQYLSIMIISSTPIKLQNFRKCFIPHETNSKIGSQLGDQRVKILFT